MEIVVMVSLGTILYLVVRTLPRIDDRETEAPVLKTHWAMTYLEKADRKLRFYWEKTLRRSGIVVLKLDNIINKKLGKLKKETDRETGFTVAEVAEEKEEREEREINE